MENYIFEKFYENKQLFKPFVSWPERVHLGLNNVDSISNKFLTNLELKKDEHVLWVSCHQANWKSKNIAERDSSGCIITDRRIYYRNITTNKCFAVAWVNIYNIIHENNTFYIQRSSQKITHDCAIPDIALLGKEINNNSPIVTFLSEIATRFRNQDLLKIITKYGLKDSKPTLEEEHKSQQIISSAAATSRKFQQNTSDLSSQDAIKRVYKELQSILQESQSNVFKLKGVNSQFNTIKNKIASAFSAKVKEAQTELNASLNGTVWDNLVIAFFGETNAGKSTIIETFRILFDDKRKKEDGLIVGDGQHDFTKTYNEYRLSIAGHPFTLIDVPGIEGDESDFKDVIKTALHKAHCVFYVQGHNKKPDRATAEKVKKYLGDWVKVYSIYNVRGSVGNYDEEEERGTLLTPGVLRTEDLIKTELNSILSDVYAGHVTLQGLLAMSAKAVFSPKREDLIRNQQKLLKYFGDSADKVLEFSQFKTLMNLVEQKSSNFKSEIIEANKQKLLSLANKIQKDIKAEMDSQKNNLRTLEDNLRTVERDVCNNCMDAASRNISNKTKNAIDSAYTNLKSEIFELIDKDSSNINQDADFCQKKAKREVEERIKVIVQTELDKVSNTANRKIKNLDGVILKPIKFKNTIDVETEIDFSGALEELDISFDDVLGWATKTAGTAAAGAALGSFIPIIGNIAGAAIGGVVGGIFHACSGDGGKADARKSVSDAIGKAKQRAINNVASMISPIVKDIEDQKRHLRNSVKYEIQNIDQLWDTIDEYGEDTKEFVDSIKQNNYGRI